MAQRLRDKKVKIDAFIASPAKRAAKTAKFLQKHTIKKDDIEFKEKLYLAEPTTFSPSSPLQMISMIASPYFLITTASLILQICLLLPG